MVMIFIGLLAGFFVYNDAKKRGHGPIATLLWSVGSTVVPFAYVVLPLYLLIGRNSKQQKGYYDHDIIDIEATVVEETINCTKCGGKVKEDFVVCPYCQEPIIVSKKDN